MNSDHLNAIRAVTPDVHTTIAERIRHWFRTTENYRRIEDASTLQALAKLEEHRLNDVGVYRKPRATKWLSVGRGMAAVPIVEFDYFRLDN